MDKLVVKSNVPDWPRIKPMDIIRWCGDEYLVLENHGPYGEVLETFKGGQIIRNFHWHCGDEGCEVIGNIMEKHE